MAAFKVRKFKDPESLERFLAGGEEGGMPLIGGVPNLAGKTLIFTSPAPVTVTFTAGAEPGKLSVAEVISQIQAAIATVQAGVTSEGARLTLVEVAPANGIGIDKTGTANLLLGFDTVADTEGTYYSYDPTPTPPCFVSFVHDAPSNSLVLLTWE